MDKLPDDENQNDREGQSENNNLYLRSEATHSLPNVLLETDHGHGSSLNVYAPQDCDCESNTSQDQDVEDESNSDFPSGQADSEEIILSSDSSDQPLPSMSSCDLHSIQAVSADSEGDFILEDDASTQADLIGIFQDNVNWVEAASSIDSDLNVLSSHATSTNNLIEVQEIAVDCGLADFGETCNANNNDMDIDIVSLYSNSSKSKLEGPFDFIVFRNEHNPHPPDPKQKRKSAQKRVLIVESREEEKNALENFASNWRAMESRINRDNMDALDVLKKIQETPSSTLSLDDFETRERYYRRKHLVSWQAAIAMPRGKKTPFETAIPLAATTCLRKKLPKLERWRRRIIKLFDFGSNRFYIQEVLTQLSVDNFNTKYNAMKGETILPGFGLQKRMKIFKMRHPDLIEKDQIMNYNFQDYIQSQGSEQKFNIPRAINSSFIHSLERMSSSLSDIRIK